MLARSTYSRPASAGRSTALLLLGLFRFRQSRPLLPALIAATLFVGCLREPLESRRTNDDAPTPAASGAKSTVEPPSQPVLLEGNFEQVSKQVSGSVRLERHGDLYELVVRNVTLNDVGPIHVYFVGLDRVRSTNDLDAVDAKYDFGPLEATGSGAFAAEQRIKLPSKPAPELRSVALINPRFGVVLASSSLQAPKP